MYASNEAGAGRASRRVTLGSGGGSPADDELRAETTLDRELSAGELHGRLLAVHDAVEERDYVALMVGAVTDSEDVPVRTVDEERLLLAGARCRCPAEILVGIGVGDDPIGVRELGRQLRRGGPLRVLLARSGARSVVLDSMALDSVVLDRGETAPRQPCRPAV